MLSTRVRTRAQHATSAKRTQQKQNSLSARSNRTKHAKREDPANHTIQCALSEEGRAKRAYEDPKLTSAAINREPDQGKKTIPETQSSTINIS